MASKDFLNGRVMGQKSGQRDFSTSLTNRANFLVKVQKVHKQSKNVETQRKSTHSSENYTLLILAFLRRDKLKWTSNGQRQKSGLIMDNLTGKSIRSP